MLKLLYDQSSLFEQFYLFQYASFRALFAAIISMSFILIFGKYFIKKLIKLSLGESVNIFGPSSHAKKSGTPTMGGILILSSLLLACLICGDLQNIYFILLLFCTLLFGIIGFCDDYSKIKNPKKGGMSAKIKMTLTLIVAFFFCLVYFLYTPTELGQKIQYEITGLFIPFVKGQFIVFPLVLAFLFWIFVIVGSSHAVNLTDGLDGLAIGTVSIVSITLCILAYITGTPWIVNYLNVPLVPEVHEISIFLAALAGAGIGFLWFNAPPASLFMGDTGSLALGSALGMSAIIIKKEMWFLIGGIVFVVEVLSVILQVLYYKRTKKRLFKMTPLHHHFELLGWPETRIVIRFWLITIVFNLFALSTLRIQ